MCWPCWLSLQMVAVIGLSILFNVPRYLDDHVVRRPDGSLALERTYLGNNATFQLVYAGLLYYIVIYALPVVILTAMTYRLLILAVSSLALLTSGARLSLQCLDCRRLLRSSAMTYRLIGALREFYKLREHVTRMVDGHAYTTVH